MDEIHEVREAAGRNPRIMNLGLELYAACGSSLTKEVPTVAKDGGGKTNENGNGDQ
jgi:hypothetical protein